MKRIVLLSGGLDSTTLLFQSVAERGKHDCAALFFDYGQKSREREREAVAAVCRDVPWYEVNISSVFARSKCSLVDKFRSVTEVVKDGSRTEYRSPDTEAEFRNGVMIAAAISVGMQIFPREEAEIALGAIKTREPFPDCSAEFVGKMDEAARLCSHGNIRVIAPFLGMGKDEIKQLALRLGVPISRTWSCYEGRAEPCGVCPACLDRKILEV